MAARKLAQEVDKCFKKVQEGIGEFDDIFKKLEQSTNQAQKEKLEDQLKREIKKLQRLRDQIKTWAGSNDIKDKAPLMENRRLIETRMESFKAIEKAMKTKAYSKEGLSAQAVLDPKEQAKLDASDFLGSMIDELGEQIEKLEAEMESIQSTSKKGKVTGAKAERLNTIGRIIERHKWHQGKMELMRRSLENGGIDADQVTDLEESIRFYVSDGMQDDSLLEDDTLYDDLNLDEDEDQFGMNQGDEKGSEEDATSTPGGADTDHRPPGVANTRSGSDPMAAAGGRRPSTQLKSPLPTLATLHAPSIPAAAASSNAKENLKPSTAPVRPPEGLKYASAAAAAAAASDKAGVGIAPLPPPPGAASVAASAKATVSPNVAPAQPAVLSNMAPASTETKTVAPAQPSVPGPSAAPSASLKVEQPATKAASARAPNKAQTAEQAEASKTPALTPAIPVPTNGATNGVKTTAPPVTAAPAVTEEEEPAEEEESVYHLPASLQDLVEAYEITKGKPIPSATTPTSQRLLAISRANAPTADDLDAPRRYYPDDYFNTPSTYPREVHSVFDNSSVYGRMDQDTLFYAFYYKQGSYQQYLASKSLKEQSWRFHKQYQTWFQRHEEPKNITEEYEQGTYRFFDYESTWMNRRKADFKFAYKFLEDEI